MPEFNDLMEAQLEIDALRWLCVELYGGTSENTIKVLRPHYFEVLERAFASYEE